MHDVICTLSDQFVCERELPIQCQTNSCVLLSPSGALSHGLTWEPVIGVCVRREGCCIFHRGLLPMIMEMMMVKVLLWMQGVLVFLW